MAAIFGIVLEIFVFFIGTLNAQSNNCFRNKADIVFLLDSSTSEGTDNFQKQLDFVKNFANDYEIGPDHVQISIITFSTSYKNNFYLNAHQDKQSLLSAIQNVPYMGGDTYTHAALAFARQNSFLSQHGGRQGVPKIMVVMTDGQSTNPYKTVDEGKLLRSTDIKVISIGIGSGISLTEIRNIATDNQHAFTVPSFDSLQSIRQEIQSAACVTVVTPAPIVMTTTTTTTTTQLNNCTSNKADVVFLLDCSSSEGDANFQKQLDFVKDFVNRFEIGPDHVQVGIVTFSSSPHNEFYLNAHPDKQSLLTSVQNVPYRGGNTYTNDALRFIRENSFKSQHGARYGVPNILVVMTDGQSTVPPETVKEANILKFTDVKIVAIGIGSGISKTEIETIASDKEHAFTVPTFDTLKSIAGEVQTVACVSEKIDSCENKTADIVFILDASGSEGMDNFRKQLQFVANFTDRVEIGPNNVQLSVVTFSNKVYNAFYLNTYSRKSGVKKGIFNATYVGSTTYTDLALKFVRENSFKPQNGGRGNGVIDLIIVLTDGNSHDHSATKYEASKIHQDGIKVISVGIGNSVSQQELTDIATDSGKVFNVKDFNALGSIESQIQSAACREPVVCGSNPTDIVFVIDSSTSEGATSFRKQLDFMSAFVQEFDVGPGAVQFGLVTSTHEAYNEFYLDTYHDKAALIAAIQSVRYRTGNNAIDRGLLFARFYQFISQRGARPNANKIAIVLSNGGTYYLGTALKEANNLKNIGVTVISIGIGNDINPYEITNIATDKQHSFTIGSFDILHTLIDDIKDETCGADRPKPTPSPDCDHRMADIVFILDASSSEGYTHFHQQLDMVRDFVYQFRIGPKDIQVSIVTFATDAKEEFSLNQYTDRTSLERAIANVRFTSGSSNPNKAIQYVRGNSFLQSKGGRSNASHIAVFLTDGQSNYPTQTATEARALKNDVDAVVAIGIGSRPDHKELLGIASDPLHALMVPDFDNLQNLTSELTFVTCNTCSFLNKADIVFLLDSSSGQGAVNFQKVLDFTSRVVNDLVIGDHSVQIGLVTFASKPQREFYLNQHNTKADLLQAIQNTHYMPGNRQTDTALQYVRSNMFTSSHGDRTDAPNYVIIVTDGSSVDQTLTLQQASLLKQDLVNVIVVGVGGSVNKVELQNMASDLNHEFEVDGFEVLRAIRDDILKSACTEVTETTPSPQLSTSASVVSSASTRLTGTTISVASSPLISSRSTQTTSTPMTATTIASSVRTTTGLLIGCRAENQTIADPNDCTRYYRCGVGDILHESCSGTNMFFNPTTSQCDLKQNVPTCQQ